MQIDFYIIAPNRFSDCGKFACQLAQKAYDANNSVLLQFENEAQARACDTLLWTLHPESFIPHNVVANTTSQIMIHPANSGQPEVLLNVQLDTPAQDTHWQRILQIIPNDEALKQSARDHYRHYQKLGYTINTHKLI